VARFADFLTDDEQAEMSALLRELRRAKPAGWSVVAGDRELVLRPKDRSVGKFGITVVKVNAEPQFSVGFFSRQGNHWRRHETFPFVSTSAAAVLSWAEETVAAESSNPEREL
jgi:hypothetical protein